MRDKFIEAIYPLSPLQRGILFHVLLKPTSGVYFEQASYTLEGELDASALARAWQRAVDRHPVLRTAFVWEGRDRPLQVVYRQARLPFAELDWRDRKSAAQRRDLAAFRREDQGRGFNLLRPPLLRLALLRLADEVSELVLSYHHLLLDGWSAGLLFAEVSAFYDAFRSGRDPQPDTPRPYRDYIAWLERQDKAEAEAYWRRTLGSLTAPTLLGIDRGAAGDAMPRYEDRYGTLDAAATNALRELARRLRVTLNAVVQAAWALLLSRYSGASDVVFGVTLSGRPSELPGVEAMIGLFINTLPLRVEVPGEMELADWLADVHRRGTELRQVESSSLVDVHGWSGVPRRQALFESLLVFENYPRQAAETRDGGAVLRGRRTQSFEYNNYPLTLTAAPGDELTLRLAYDARRFTDDAVERLLEHLSRLLTELPADPRRQLAAIPLLSASERQEVLAVWPGEAAPEMLAANSLAAAFEAHARSDPESEAAVDAERRLTYGQLNAAANRLSRHLQALGVLPGDRVAIGLERGVDTVVALLAVLKAGAAYVPIDPRYPAARRRYLLSDSGVDVLISRRPPPADNVAVGLQLVDPDADAATIAAYRDDYLPATIGRDHTAYVIYTSGTTGQPKGVVVSHGNVLDLMAAGRRRLGFAASDVWTLFHSFSFDFSVWELWGALAFGGRVVVVDYPVSRSPEAFWQLLMAEGVTVLGQTPSASAALLRHLAQAAQATTSPPPIRLVVLGAEALEFESAAGWFELPSPPLLANMYGITETTVISMFREVVREEVAEAPERFGSRIGRGLPGMPVFVLNERGEALPAGVAGEMYVGGSGVSRGYLDRPGLTATRFVPDAFRNEPGSRLYRSGDCGRWLAGGDMEYLGRTDSQIKIRGFRIEPGEVESALRGHPAVSQAVVVARRSSGEARLVAYVVPPDGSMAATGELRGWLKSRVPEHLVPSSWVELTSLPLTVNGKVDRGALPDPGRQRPDLAASFVAPRTPVEEVLAGLWAEVLGVERIGAEDDFFDLGGHSLLATQIVARVRKVFKVELPLQSLFEATTVAALARALEDYEAVPGRTLEIARTLRSLESLSPAEMKKLLADKRLEHSRR